MQHILDMHFLGLIILLCAFPIGFAFLLYWTSQYSVLAERLQAFEGMSAASIGTVGLLFWLFAAFLASDIWQRVHLGQLSFAREVTAIENLQNIAEAMEEDGKPIQLILQNYAKVSIYGTWSNEGDQYAGAGDILKRLFPAILEASQAKADRRAAQTVMLAVTREIFHARAERNYIATSHSDPHKWVAVILLGLLTQLAIALTYVERSKVQAVALAIFTLAFVVSIATFAMHERPQVDPVLTSLKSQERLELSRK